MARSSRSATPTRSTGRRDTRTRKACSPRCRACLRRSTRIVKLDKARMSAVACTCAAALGAGWCTSAWAAHAYAQFGDIKYPPGFSHFEWVNPDAPKGGELQLVPPLRISNFDKYNPFTLKGTSAPALSGLVFESLLTG